MTKKTHTSSSPSSSPSLFSPGGSAGAQGPWPAKWIGLVLITLLVTVLDLGSKEWAQQDLQQRITRRMVLIEGYLNFSYVRNPGAAWGFLAQADDAFRRPFFIAISLVAMAFIFYLFLRLERGQWLLMTALALVMGGAVGNFVDRLRYNYVVDFIDFHIRHHFRWPTFNVADIAITVGVILLFIEMFFLQRYREQALAQQANAGGAPTAPASKGGAPAQASSVSAVSKNLPEKPPGRTPG
jgi:signal peptidase II